MIFSPCATDLGTLVESQGEPLFDTPAGWSLWEACDVVCARALLEGRTWCLLFNDRRVFAEPGESSENVSARWQRP